jgi:hypothetical protein
MDPFTLALAAFGVQKLRGKSTNRALRDALFAGGLGQFGAMAGASGLQGFGQGTANKLAGQTLGQQFMQTAPMQTAQSLFGGKVLNPAESAGAGGERVGIMQNIKNMLPKSTAGKVALAAAGIPFLEMFSGDTEPAKKYLPIPNQAYAKFAKSGAPGSPTGFMVRDYTTGVDTPLADPATYRTVEEILGDQPTQNFKAAEFNQGGLASIARFNEGGQALPSKFSHSEHDMNNYTRAHGFVKDGAGMGDENEDTMLAQLADGEFVSRAAAVRGAGILAGADINSKEDQRKKGAEFFYEQQRRFKRIMDLLDASRKDN